MGDAELSEAVKRGSVKVKDAENLEGERAATARRGLYVTLFQRMSQTLSSIKVATATYEVSH